MPLAHSLRRLIVVALLGLSALLPAMLPGQEPAKPDMEETKEAPIREQSIYIPYAKLRAMFEKEGRGVFLPYDKFQELWKAAQAATRKLEDIKPPFGALITEIDSQATVQKDVVSVTARLSIDVLTEGWHEVPLRLSDAAIRSAKIGDEAARVVFSPDGTYKLLYEKKGKEPSRVELVLEYSKAFSKAPGTNTVQFDAPQAPVNRWNITIAEPGVKVQVHPNLSATDGAPEVKEVDPANPEVPAKETKVEAFVGAAPQVRIDWNPKAEGAAGQMALVTVQVREEVMIEEGVMRTKAHLAYEISRADLKELSLEVPKDQNVVNVFDANVQKWEKKIEGPLQTMTIQLFQPARGTQNVTVELEKFSDDKEMMMEMGRKEFIAPDIKVLNVARQQGIVVARLGGSLRGEVASRKGLFQIDAADLPPPLAGQDWPFAYRYAAHPYALTLSVEKVRPLIEVEELVEAYLEPQGTTYNLLAIYNIQKAGVFQLELNVPEGYEIRQVQGRDAVGAAAMSVDSHHVDEVAVAPDKKAKTRLVVNLSRKAIGKVALWVELARRQEDPNLQSPTGTKSALDITMPRVAPDKVARVTGRLIVYAPNSLRITPTDVQGLRAIAFTEALQGVESTRAGRFEGTRELLAFAYTQEPASLKVEAERRQPFVTAEQLLFVQFDSGVAKYEITLNYEVLYSGIKTLRIDVPADLYDKKELRLPPSAIKEKKLDPQPKDVPTGYVALELSGEAEFKERFPIKFIGERKLANLQVGKSVKMDIPSIQPHGIDRHTGKIAAAKTETIDLNIDGTPKGLRPIDPQRDLVGVSLPAAASRAFEFTDDWSLTLIASRYELEEVKRTSIDRAFVRMVITRGNETSVQCLYRLRSAKQRIAIKLPASVDATKIAFDRQSLRVNGQSVSLETDKQQYFIPLVGHKAEDNVLVEFRYTVPGTETSLELPEFPDDPAVQQVYLAAYLPAERKLLGVRGPWSEEDTVAFGSEVRSPSRNDDQLLRWVNEGVNCDIGPFSTEASRYLYSALRPEAGSAGALRLVAMHRYVLWTLTVLVVAGVGLVLSTQKLAVRLWWLAALVVAAVLSALFAPTFANVVLDDVFYWSLALVLFVWFVQYLIWLLPQVSAWISARAARAAAMATAVAAAATASPPAAGNAPQPEGGSPFASSPAGPTDQGIKFGDIKPGGLIPPPPTGDKGNDAKEGGKDNG